MIAVDSSVLVAVAVDEPGAADFTTIVLSAPCIASWATIFETRMILSDRGKEALRILEDWIVRPNVTLDPFDAPQYRDAVIAFERFGRGRHPAKLNFGDCMSYAVAKHHGVPLLYKGNDFRLTDIRSALP